jgi:hypothetical protein
MSAEVGEDDLGARGNGGAVRGYGVVAGDSIGISDAGTDSSPPGVESERVGVGVPPGLQAAATAARATMARSRLSN